MILFNFLLHLHFHHLLTTIICLLTFPSTTNFIFTTLIFPSISLIIINHNFLLHWHFHHSLTYWYFHQPLIFIFITLIFPSTLLIIINDNFDHINFNLSKVDQEPQNRQLFFFKFLIPIPEWLTHVVTPLKGQ